MSDTEWRLVRRGQRGYMHPAFPSRQKWRTLCGQDLSGKLTVWAFRVALDAWNNDEARHCPGCERRINADLLAR